MDAELEQLDSLSRERIADAERMTPEQKLYLGGDLFDDLCERMRAGIRFQFPDADDCRVEEILTERLDIARRLEQDS